MFTRRLVVIAGLTWLTIFSGYSQFSVQSLKFGEVFDKISRFYVDTINENKFIEQVVEQMLHDLDPHSSYLTKEDVQAMQEPLEGNFEGIGVSFNILKDTIFIVNPIPGGPSEKLGIRPGDRIVRIDGENVAGVGITNADVMKKLKGSKGTKVTVSIRRRNVEDLIDFVITRSEIPVYSIDASYMIDDKNAYIKLSRFSLTSTKEFEDALINLKKRGMQNLVLDLSLNGGGYLKIAVELADHFINGKKMIVYTEGAQNPRRNYYSTDIGDFETGKLVIMIDEGAASASEIVAGAIQDWDRGVIVGRKSFGKGLVQQPFQLSDGSMIRLTVAKYYTPTGRLIQKPYQNGYDEYTKDLRNRLDKGEMTSSDSITFPDSLKFKTMVLNRIVYGGGGIMPDYFVPMDTSLYSDYYRDIISKGIFNQFVLNYEDRNRSTLASRYNNFNKFDKEFVVDDNILHDLVKYAEKEGVAYVKEDLDKSKALFSLLIKSYIARDLWTSSEFYRVFNQQDPIYLKAVEVITEPDLYQKKLQAYTGE